MAKRTVHLALIAYTSAEEGPQFGMLNEEVDVHKDDVKRFDRLNDQYEADPVPAEVNDDAIAQPVIPVEEEAAQGSTEPEEPLERPSNKAHLADWQDYAEQEGVELEHADGKAKTKAELIAELSD